MQADSQSNKDSGTLSRSEPVHHREPKANFLLLSLLASLFAFTSITASPAPLTEKQKIAALLDTITTSKIEFIRSGQAYSPARARAHMEFKLGRAGDRIKTAEQFIEYIATRSYLTGSPYLIRFPDGKTVPAGSWLRQKLAIIIAEHEKKRKVR